MFLYAKDILAQLLCNVFDHIYSSNKYPESWTKGVIVPIPKTENLEDVNNYRGITLTSIFFKNYLNTA